MKFFEFICNPAIRPALAGSDRESVVRELVGALVDAEEISPEDRSYLVRAILKREELGSTAIGNEVAIPHTKHPTLDHVVCAVGVSRDGIDFDAADGQKVHVFFLVISPAHHAMQHLRVLERITRQVRDKTFCGQLRRAAAASHIQQLFEAADGLQAALAGESHEHRT